MFIVGMLYRDVEGLLECPFQGLQLIVGMVVKCKGSTGSQPISCAGLAEVKGYGQCVLVDQGHGGR